MASKIIIAVLLVTCMASCRMRDPYVMDKAALSTARGTTKPDTSALRPAAGDTVNTVFVNGRARNLIHKDSNQTVYLAFNSEEGKTLRGKVYSKDPDANLRISQIIMPDGTMDGPFGWDITYQLPETGTYRLAIHENMMAGSPWEGDFKVELAVK